MLTPIGEIIVRNSWDEAVVKEVVLEHQYENWGEIKIEGTVLDCGAHIGSFTKLALSHGCKVTAVEPEPGSFKLLEINGKGATLINKAITNEKEIHLWVDSERGELNKIASEGLLVKGITLDELITEPIDLLKMDIEGAEYDAIYSCTKLSMIRQITMEYHNGMGKLGGLMDFLAENGFEFGWVGGGVWGHLQCKRYCGGGGGGK